MQVTRIILCLGLVLCAPAPSFGAHAKNKKKPAVERTVQTKKKLRAKPRLEKKKKLPRRKLSEKSAPEKPPAEKMEPPKIERKLDDTRWTDPMVLRDTLFLSAEKKTPQR